MARLNVLEYAAEFVRGWPHGEAVQMNYPSATAVGNGDIVAIAANGNVIPSVGAEDEVIGMVARGVNDTFNGGGTGTNNLYNQVVPNIVLMSNFVVRTSNVDAAPTTPFAAGMAVGPNATGNLAPLSDADVNVEFGKILEIETGLTDANGAAVPTALTVLVK